MGPVELWAELWGRAVGCSVTPVVRKGSLYISSVCKGCLPLEGVILGIVWADAASTYLHL